LIGAFLDEELTADQGNEVAAHLAGCALCREVATDYRRIGSDLAQQGRVPPSPAFVASLRQELARKELASAPASRAAYWPKVSWRQMAAGLTIALLSSSATYLSTRTEERASAVQHDVIAAHVRSMLQDNQIQVASSDSHTVRPWFVGKLDFAPEIKDLAKEGFPLIGGRIDYVDGHRVAVAVYKRNQHWVNVFIWPAAGAPGGLSAVSASSGHNIVTWSRSGFAYWAISDLNPEELQKLESLI
jgi:anti-sigma factor RsiW